MCNVHKDMLQCHMPSPDHCDIVSFKRANKIFGTFFSFIIAFVVIVS